MLRLPRPGALAVLLAFGLPSFPSNPDFENKIRPLLAANCLECHSEKTKTSGFSVASLESVVAGGNKHEIGRAHV